MLRTKILRKIYITSLIIFVLFIISSFTINKNITNIKVEYQTKISSIYLLDENNYLLKVNISVKDNINDNIPIIINSLKEDNKHYSGLRGLIPTNTEINDYKIDNKILYIDFNDNLLKVNDSLKEKIIESIVFSFISFTEIDGVKITINGNLINIGDEILTKDFGINKEYDFKRPSNIEKVVLYYYENKDNNNYYVPVTKYINSTDDKIKVIIDNLRTNYLIKTNLMSYLNDRINILKYEKTNNIVTISFANLLDFKNDDIREEVIYTLSNSLLDSNVATKVIFMQDDRIITVK